MKCKSCKNYEPNKCTILELLNQLDVDLTGNYNFGVNIKSIIVGDTMFNVLLSEVSNHCSNRTVNSFKIALPTGYLNVLKSSYLREIL